MTERSENEVIENDISLMKDKIENMSKEYVTYTQENMNIYKENYEIVQKNLAVVEQIENLLRIFYKTDNTIEINEGCSNEFYLKIDQESLEEAEESIYESSIED